MRKRADGTNVQLEFTNKRLIMALHRTGDEPLPCTLHAHQTVEFEWLPEKTYTSGTELQLRVDRMRCYYFWKYVHAEMDRADVTWRWRTYPHLRDMHENPDRVVFTAGLPRGAVKGEALTIRLTLIAPYIDTVPLLLSLWIKELRSGGETKEYAFAREVGSSTVVSVTGAAVERLGVWCRPTAGPEGTVRAVVSPLDRFGNPSRFKAPVFCELMWNGTSQARGLEGPLTMELDSPQGVSRLRVAIPMAQLAADENIANATRDGDRLVVTGNPVWEHGPQRLLPAFGEFHWHTDFSGDGQGCIETALGNARDAMNLDFAAPSDHSPDVQAWKQSVNALDAFEQPGYFATFYGWERSTKRGHENYYFTDANHPMCCHGNYAEAMAARASVHDDARGHYSQESNYLCIPHHTNAVSESRTPDGHVPVWHPYPWAEPEPALRMVEIMQVRGNQERNDYTDQWMGWHQHNRASVQDALARGHKVGFTGGTDNHMAWPGRAWEPAEANLLGGNGPMHSVILTGIWTEGIKRQAVFDALYARHTWAIWNTRAIVRFEINGVLMGGELRVAAGAALAARLELSAQDSLQTVEVVSAGEVVWQQSFAEWDVDVEIPLGPACSGTYFYVRARQRDGGLIYASPVFLEVTA